MFDLFSDFIIKRTLGREAAVEFSKIHYSVQAVFSHISLEISPPIQLHIIAVAIKQLSASYVENPSVSTRVEDFMIQGQKEEVLCGNFKRKKCICSDDIYTHVTHKHLK